MARVPEWYDNHVNVVELVRWLVDRGDIPDTAKAANDIHEKPWKWTPEFNAMAAQNWQQARSAQNDLGPLFAGALTVAKREAWRRAA